jgi:uncharacterized SAM-binding protein YcdF (DUF218 family)
VRRPLSRIYAFLVSARLRRFVVRVIILWLAGILLLGVIIYLYGRIDHAQPADVIVVLGAGIRADNRPGAALIRRSEQAATLWKKGLAEHVICSGGFPGHATRSEADACGELLRAEGVPASAILLEESSRSTEENAFYTRQIMDMHGWQTAIIVSDGFHLLRATWLFNQVGIANYTSPATDPQFSDWVMYMGRELAAFHWQTFKDLLNLPFTYVPLV